MKKNDIGKELLLLCNKLIGTEDRIKALKECAVFYQTAPEDALLTNEDILELTALVHPVNVRFNEKDGIKLLLKHDFFNEKRWLTYLYWSKKDKERFNFLIYNLHAANFLTNENIQRLIDLINEKLPYPTEVKIIQKEKISLTQANDKEISYYLFSNSVSTFIKRQKNEKKSEVYDFGIYPVRKVYTDLTKLDTPAYSCKKFTPEEVSPKAKDDKKTAKRECKYNTLLGRSSFYFNNGQIEIRYNKGQLFDVYEMIAEWQFGENLENIKPEIITQFSTATRLEHMIDFLKQVEKLHEKMRVHGDMKPSNVIFNSKTGSLKLIDFGSAHKLSKKIFPYTRNYTDGKSWVYGFNDDVYGIAIIFGCYFPEYIAFPEQPPRIAKLKLACNKGFSYALKHLLSHMQQPDKDARPNIRNILQFCMDWRDLDCENSDKVNELIQLHLKKEMKDMHDVITKMLF
jgi:hypothetical protein